MDESLRASYVGAWGGPFVVREGREADAARLLAFKSKVFRETELLLQGPEDFHSDEDQEAIFLRRFRVSQNSAYLIAEADRRIIGTLSLYGGYFKRNRHVGHLGMGVLQEYWGCGVGGSLLEQGIEWARANPYIEKLSLQVYDTNERAIRLYRARGFVQEAVLADEVCLDDGSYVDLVVMSRRV